MLDDFLSLVVEPIGLQFAAEDFSLVVVVVVVVVVAAPLLALFEEGLEAPPPFMVELLFLRLLFFCELLLELNLLFLLFIFIGTLLP